MARDNHRGAFLFGVVVGAIGGAAAMLFMTPRSGEEVRRSLTGATQGLREQAMTATAGAREQSRAVAGPYVERVASTAQRGVERGSTVARATSERIRLRSTSSVQGDDEVIDIRPRASTQRTVESPTVTGTTAPDPTA